MKKTRLNTKTVMTNGDLVPWLASGGPYSYTPESPPSSDELFDYAKLFPGVFLEKAEHPFGWRRKSEHLTPYVFWEAARRSQVKREYLSYGRNRSGSMIAPIAVYSYHEGREYYAFLQNGSFQSIAKTEQPLIPYGSVILYRGVGNHPVFEHESIRCQTRQERDVVSLYKHFLFQSFTCSRTAFLSATDGICRDESRHLSGGTGLFSQYVKRYHTIPDFHFMFSQMKDGCSDVSFTLSRSIATEKFGPHFVALRTPLTNIRITPFFCGESEVRLLNPNRVQFLPLGNCHIERRQLSFQRPLPKALILCKRTVPVARELLAGDNMRFPTTFERLNLAQSDVLERLSHSLKQIDSRGRKTAVVGVAYELPGSLRTKVIAQLAKANPWIDFVIKDSETSAFERDENQILISSKRPDLFWAVIEGLCSDYASIGK